MISPNTIKNYCCEDISLIENYDIAISSAEQYECHHRGELLPCGKFSSDDLKKFGLYWSRPASELIFLSATEHRQLHMTGNTYALNSKGGGFTGKTHTRQSRDKISSHNGNNDGHSTRGKHWWNNGTINKVSKEKPGTDFVRGFLKLK